mmetsp:Transcript_22032/g.30302  ORF Transcript_22032/g.30302 Transcript_22032/m.30302 type:complete len:216 (-) Transcript_22032:81-728(-)
MAQDGEQNTSGITSEPSPVKTPETKKGKTTPNSSKRSAQQKRKAIVDQHLLYSSRAFESLLETVDVNCEMIVPGVCFDPSIQKILQELLQTLLLFVWRMIVTHVYSAPFLVPVKETEAPAYFSIISNPMDLSTIRKRIESGEYRSPEDMVRDIHLMCDNCRVYCTNRFPHLVPQAEVVLDLCTQSLELLNPAFQRLKGLIIQTPSNITPDTNWRT